MTLQQLQAQQQAMREYAEKQSIKLVFEWLARDFEIIRNTAVREGVNDAMIKVSTINIHDTRDIYTELYTKIGKYYYDNERKHLERYKRTTFSFFDEIWKQYILRALGDFEIVKRITGVTNTTKERFRALLIQAADNRLAPRQISRLFRESEKYLTTSRAQTIARTEMGHAASIGTHYAAENSQLELYKLWNHYAHGDYRDWHAEMDNKYVPFNEKFNLSTGKSMIYPHDPNGGAKECINCRCNYSNVTKDVLVEIGLWKGGL